MKLVGIKKIVKMYGDKIVLDIDKFEVFEGDRIGIVGRNGQGKSTLLKIIIGEEKADSGDVYLNKSYSYISQRVDEIHGELSQDGINNRETRDDTQKTRDCITIGDKEDVDRVSKILNSPKCYSDELSGGEKTRLKIARAMKERRLLLIADEPTSNMDSEGVAVLQELLEKYDGSIILVSHDRGLLDKICNKIVEIQDGSLSIYNGNYEDYEAQKELEVKKQTTEYEKYVDEKKRIEDMIVKRKKQSAEVRRTPKRMGNSEARLHRMGGQNVKQKLDYNANAYKTRLEQLEVKERPKEEKDIKIRIQDGIEIIGKNVLEVKDLTLFNCEKTEINGENIRILLDKVSFKIKKGKKVALIGPNGCGKTSLIKKIIEVKTELDKNVDTLYTSNIRLNPRVVIGYFDQEQKVLDEDKTVLENVKRSSSFDETLIRMNLNLFGFSSDDIRKKVEVLSGGEKVKVSICKIILEDNNFLILDEPTNYLDIKSIIALEESVKNTEKGVLIVSHDQNFMTNTCDAVLEIANKGIIQIDESYAEYMSKRGDLKKQSKHLDASINRKDSIMKANVDEGELLRLKNKLSLVISEISTTGDEQKKEALECEYRDTLAKIKILQGK
ncbi:MAG: ATP-binding cassette domain-containing protein [Clostridioides sp.]|nr:ATP-binding cassette domain-containing protein [Clostridioides sp.]